MSSEPAQPAPPADETSRLAAEVERLKAEVEALSARAAAAEALADHDTLTPLLNRRAFVRELGRAMSFCRRYDTPAALIYVDLDGFKAVNDKLGHAAGDEALVKVAEIILANIRDSDAAGRLGGDEFAILLIHVDQAAAQAKARILQALIQAEGAAMWDGQAVLGGSFGVRVFDGQTDPEAWLAEADAAMWVRKRGR